MLKLNTKQILGISLVLHILVAIGSIGFFHPDEQYYAFDFALFKSGFLATLSTWELDAQIRPWLLPFIYTLILSPLKLIGVTNPFSIALYLRLISALFSWFSLSLFSTSLKTYFTEAKSYKYFQIFIHSFWVLLFMNVRTSSENWATAFFLIAISILLRKGIFNKKVEDIKLQALSGLFLGLSFSLRHQMGLMAFTFGIWILINKRITLRDWFLYFSSSIAIGVIIGIGADYWGYGELTFTPYNYLKENLINDKISTFGVSPWWSYFKYIFIKLTPVYGIPLILTFFYLLYKKRSDVFTWIIIPFFIFHCLIGHKELRFLYPILPLALVFITTLITKEKILRSLLYMNLIGILIVAIKPAYTPLVFYKYLWNFEKGDVINLYVLKDRKGRYPILEMDFYKRKLTNFKKVDSLNELNSIKDTTKYLFTTKYSDLEKLEDCKTHFISYPKYLLNFNFFKWRDRSSIWALSSCN